MTRRQFRILVLFSLAARVLSEVAHVLLYDSLPSSLIEYLDGEPLHGIQVLVGMAVMLLVIKPVAYLGLLVFSSWSRHLFLLSLLFDTAIILRAPVVVPAAAEVAYDLSNISAGAILAAAYLSPLSRDFTEQKRPFAERADLQTLTGVLLGAAYGALGCLLLFGLLFLSVSAKHGRVPEGSEVLLYGLATIGFALVSSIVVSDKAFDEISRHPRVRSIARYSALVVGGSGWIAILCAL